MLTGLWPNLLSHDSRAINPRYVREIARQLCQSAHEEQLRAEQLVVNIKQSWWEYRDRLSDAEQRKRGQAVVSDVISVCIEEFFHVSKAG